MASATDTGQYPGGGRGFQQIKEELAQNILSLQEPHQLVTLLSYMMPLPGAISVIVEANIFERIAKSPSPVTAAQLAKELENESSLDPQDTFQREEYITRLLRAISALGLIDETGPSTYRANDLTRTYADPARAAGWLFMFNNMLQNSGVHHMVGLAKRDGWKAPTNSKDGPFQHSNGIVGTDSFTHYYTKDIQSMSHLNTFMSRLQKDRLNWSAWFPADRLFGQPVEGEDADGVFMVDVGGGLGHDLNSFANRYPDRKMRLVLQDMPEVLQEAKEQKQDPRIELAEHDFFLPQPVKGAKIYFMHKIMHDWNDEESATIISHLRDAMGPHSRLFLNDLIVPDQNSGLFCAASDLSMLALLSAKERSESMWRRLVDRVDGLAIQQFWQSPGLQAEGIVEVVKV